MSVRDIVKEIQSEVHSENLLPDRASELLNKLSSIYGNVLDRIQQTEFAYNNVLLSNLDKEKTANKAKIRAEISQEYQDFVEAKNTEKLVTKMMSSLKVFIKQKQEEFRMGGNM